MMIDNMLKEARRASRMLLSLSDERINELLYSIASAIRERTDEILAANALDLEKMSVENPKYDRLKLTRERLESIAADIKVVATLRSPRRELERRRLPNKLLVRRVAVPFGVIGIIYEARPNVTIDVFSLCLKSGNACVLKGGSEAENSNKAIVGVIRATLESEGIDANVLTMLPSTREATEELLSARGKVDLIIPRGGAALIENVREKSRIPMIETGAGVCHCYLDEDIDLDIAIKVVTNAKTRRVSVCNALDCLLVHRDLVDFLPGICKGLAEYGVVIHADEESYRVLRNFYPKELLEPSTEADYGTEYLSYQMSVKTVGSMAEAIDHISKYGSGHSESIVTEKKETGRYFQNMVDAACVYVNAPTSFTDGGQFGLGAEIGISTQKLHARGPMGLESLMTYKWLIEGKGQVRKP